MASKILILICCLLTVITNVKTEGNVDLTVKFLLSMSKNPSLLCSSLLPSCVPKAFRLDITVRSNKKSPSSSFIDIDSVTMSGPERGRFYGRFDRRISLSNLASPVTLVEVSLMLTPRCSEKCGKPAKSTNGTFKVNLMAYKQQQMSGAISFSGNSLLQVDAIVNYKYKCSSKFTGSNCHCYPLNDECGSDTYLCTSKSTSLCCFTIPEEEDLSCVKDELTTLLSIIDSTTTGEQTTTINTETFTTTINNETFTTNINENFQNVTVANETYLDGFSPQISSIASGSQHSTTVAVGCTAAVLLGALLIGLLAYQLAKRKADSPTPTVTFYYEEGNYAEIESEKWQNIVSLCTTMEDVENEIRRSMAHLYAASSICSTAYEGVHKSISVGANLQRHDYDKVYDDNKIEQKKPKTFRRNLQLKPIGFKMSQSASNIRYNSNDVCNDQSMGKSLFDELKEVGAVEEGIYEEAKSLSTTSYASVGGNNPYDSVCNSPKSNSLRSTSNMTTTVADVHKVDEENKQTQPETKCKNCARLKRTDAVKKNPVEAGEVRKSLLEHKRSSEPTCECDSDNSSLKTPEIAVSAEPVDKKSQSEASGNVNLTYDDIEETLW